MHTCIWTLYLYLIYIYIYNYYIVCIYVYINNHIHIQMKWDIPTGLTGYRCSCLSGTAASSSFARCPRPIWTASMWSLEAWSKVRLWRLELGRDVPSGWWYRESIWDTGFLKKNSHPVKLIAKKLACPLSPNSMLLHRFAWKGLKKKQPFRFGCRHALGNNIDQGGTGGSGVMWQHVGGWLFFLKNPGKIFWFMDVQTQAWTNSLLHLPKPQSKHTFIFKASTQQTKKHKIYFFGLMALQTQAWTNSRLHLPKPQSKHTFIFTAATQQTKKLQTQAWTNSRLHVPKPNPNTLSSSQLLPTNKECSSTPPEAELHKLRVLQCTYSARTVHGTVHAAVHGHKTL